MVFYNVSRFTCGARYGVLSRYVFCRHLSEECVFCRGECVVNVNKILLVDGRVRFLVLADFLSSRSTSC